ncbi:MAG: 2-oxo acid dehydrogenase subunit [Sphingomonadales bacterium]|nr:2-oxo acid dehydrogenase subunit [Sphingomonadales bacterium]
MTTTDISSEANTRITRISGVRRFIADKMMESLASSAQLTFHGEADAGRFLELRAGWKRDGIASSIEDCLIVAFARTLKAQPDLNGTATRDEIALSDAVHIAIAIASQDGLKTPVIRNADAKSLEAITGERKDFAARASTRKLQVSEMKGATATISNLGTTRVQHFTPILNNGQMVLLGIGCVTSRLSLDADRNVIERQMLGLSLTVDHRVVDGEPAGRFLTQLCQEIETFKPA